MQDIYSFEKNMETKERKFPDGFLWGAATAAHQVEGGMHNNWSEWEKKNAARLAGEAKGRWEKWQQEKFPEMFISENYLSGRACDHYNRFAEDFDLAKSLGHNAHRFSIEWSRIEPSEGKFDEKEIEHYRQVIRALRDRGMEPFVTLWHWTHPVWLEEKGGAESSEFPGYFSRYARYVTEKLGTEVKFWMTLNEPTSVILNSYWQGNWPPQKRSIFAVLKVFRVLSRAHNLAYDEIKKNHPEAQVGFGNILEYIEPADSNNPINRFTVWLAGYFADRKFLKMVAGKNDYLAMQYYFHRKLDLLGRNKNANKTISDLGWEVYPEGIYHILRDLKKHNLPIYITENGIADADDSRRAEFIREHLAQVGRAIGEGVDVRGYFYWSLLDNFEWDKGFWPRFGLIGVDYETLERKVRQSALEYAKICRKNKITD